MQKTSDNRLLALDGLRFVAALLVVISHNTMMNFGANKGIMLEFLVHLSGAGMTLFFVLSGFVIHYHYHLVTRERGKVGVANFLWLRFSRLYPLYIALLLVDILSNNRTLQMLQNGTDYREALLTHLLLVQTWYYNIINVNNLIYQFGLGPQVAWSISTEMFFYIVYIPLSIFLTRMMISRRRVLWFTTVVVVGFYVFFMYLTYMMPSINDWAVGIFGPYADQKISHQDSFNRWLIYFSPYARFYEFLLGTLTASLYMLTYPKGQKRQRYAIRTFLLMCLIIVLHSVMYLVPQVRSYVQVTSMLYTPFIAVLIYLLASSHNIFTRVLSHPVAVRYGQASYSIYLLHLPISYAFKQSVINSEISGILFQLMRMSLTIAVVMVIGRGVYLVFELPMQNFLRRNKRLFLPVVAGFIVICVAGLAYIHNREQMASLMPKDGIRIVSATYGRVCGATSGNVTGHLADACDGGKTCDYTIRVETLGDPANGCGKDFDAVWMCGKSTELHKIHIEGEAGLGKIAMISCKEAD